MTSQHLMHKPADSLAHRSSPSLNWRQEYLHLTVILMTGCSLAGWVALSLNWFLTISFATSLGLTLVHLVSSMALIRWMIHRKFSDNLQYTSLLLAMSLAAVLTILIMPALANAYGGMDRLSISDMFYIDRQSRVPAGPIVAVWVLLLWWRGAQVGTAYTTLVRATFGMRLGLLSLLLLMLVGGSGLRQDFLGVVPVFFFFGLLSTSLARAESLSLDQSTRDTPFGRGWLLSLFVLSAVVTFGGYLVALWFSGMNLDQAGNTVTTIGEGIITVLFLLFSPLALLGQLLYDGLDRIIPDEMPRTSREASGEGSGGNNSQLQAPWIADLFDVLSTGLLVGIGLLILILFLAFLWFLFVARSGLNEHDDDERERIGTGEMVGNLQNALRDTWRRLADAINALRQFGIGRNLFAVLTIRRIYARMEQLAGERGYPRATAETPYEYQQELRLAFPTQPDAIRHITQAYIAVRYGELPEDPDQLNAVRTSWETLRTSPPPD